MGASASMAPIAEEILELDAAKVYDAHGLCSRRLNLSKEVLESIRRKSYTLSSSARRKAHGNKDRDSFKLRLAASRHYDVPSHVTDFLEKIGVNDKNTTPTQAVSTSIISMPFQCPVSMQNEKTTKLIGHIFECLGALQHLVRANQSDISTDINDETQSMNDMNTKSVGKLLHEMVTIYGLCGDTINALLDADPDAAGVEDTLGRLPLHVCCDRDEPWMDMVAALVEARPEALNCRDGAGRLPLHVALDRQNPSLEVVQLLVRAHPAAASARRGVGRLPIHYACFSDLPSVDIIHCLLACHPEGAQAIDVYGKLPIHYVADRAEPNLEVILCLLQAYPHGASVRDSHQATPLKLAVKQGTKDFRVVRALIRAYPQGPSIQGQFGRLPLHAAIECQNPCEQTIRILAKSYPVGVFMITKALAGNNAASTAAVGTGTGPVRAPEGAMIIGAKDNSPFQTSMNKNRFDLARVMLLACPYCSPAILGDLNWKIRKIAFEITNFGTPFICDYDSDEEKEEDVEEGNKTEKGEGKKGEGEVQGSDDDLIIAVVSKKESIASSTCSSRISHSVSFSRPGTKDITPVLSKSSIALSEGCLKISKDRIHTISSNNSSKSTRSRMPPMIIRPSPYARMMSSTFHTNDKNDRHIDRGEWERIMTSRSISSDACSPRSPVIINLLHGLYIINTDLWRLVITFL